MLRRLQRCTSLSRIVNCRFVRGRYDRYFFESPLPPPPPPSSSTTTTDTSTTTTNTATTTTFYGDLPTDAKAVKVTADHTPDA